MLAEPEALQYRSKFFLMPVGKFRRSFLMPDVLVINISEYQRVLSKALSYTSDKKAIVTIGIKLNCPGTGYGYIAAAQAKWR